MFPADQLEHPVLNDWLGSTTCGVYSVRRSVLFENSEFIVLKHGSHASWCGRFTGNLTCCSYAALYRQEDIGPRSNSLMTGSGFIKKWEGRISLKRIQADCKVIGIDFQSGAANELVA